jgi:CubicO group peptidase (beta-lactamase class C family)
MKKIALIFALSCSFLTVAQDRFTKMDSLLTYLYENNKFMGSLCIREGENVVFNKAYGFADVEKNISADRFTKYKIGSISKTFTAVMIMQLIEEKKLNLQTKLNRFYPKIPNAEKISIYDVLHHRSGIVDYVNQDTTFHQSLDKKYAKEDIIKVITANASKFEPGSKYEYSNSNYFLLGCIIETLTKRSFAENLETRIVKKAKLSNTFYSENRINSANNESYSFLHDGTKWNQMPESHNSIPFSSGGITSNPADLTRFLDALFHEKLVNKKSLEQMKEIVEGYGIGLAKIPFGERKFYGHGGVIDQYRSLMGYYPAEDLSYALICSSTNYDLNDAVIGILSIYYKMPFPFPTFTKIDRSKTEAFLGTYSCKDLPIKITVSEKNNELIAQATGQSAFPLTFKEEKTFIFAPAGIEMIFGENSFVLKQGGMSFNFSKE